MAYAILRTEKLKTFGGIGGSAGHTYRDKGMAPNADPERLGRNQTLKGSPGRAGVVEDVRRRIDQVTDKPRSNAVLCVELLLTASPEFFKDLTAKQKGAWVKKNMAFLKATYGKENVVHVVLHEDEQTPHLVAYVVPEKDGKLNCRAYLGGRDKMTKLQSLYAEAMKPFGLQRGVEGSKAEHRTVKEYYASLASIDRDVGTEMRKVLKPIPPPEPSLTALVNKDKRAAELRTWEKQETARTERVVKTAGKALQAAKLAKEDIGVLKSQNSRLHAENEDLRQVVADLREMLELSKDEVSRLRKLDVSLVAERLGYFGEIKRNENSIDLVKRVGDLDYQQSVAWLHAEFGEVAAAQAVREHINVSKPERPLTKAERVITREVHRQLDALGCDTFRLSLIQKDGEGAPYLPGKPGKDGEERFYSRTDVENLVPYLRYENGVGGRHIYITPMDDHAYYVLVDDLRISSQDFLTKGFEPCLVQRTSWNSLQAVCKVPKADVDRRAVIDVFNDLNRSFGDDGISGLRHPFRLAGFRNMKPKHEKEGRFPFVEILHVANRFCRKTWSLVTKRDAEIQDAAPTFRTPKM